VAEACAGVKRVSGYSADKESANSNSITCIKKRKRANIAGMTAKKRKVDELHYQAASTRSTLAQGNKLSARFQTRGPCALPHGSIDINIVKLITVSRNNPYAQDIPAKNEDVSIYPSILK